MENNLPHDLIIEILSWLPVKSLIIFKTVCKSWHSIISKQIFVEKHTQKINTYENQNTSDILRSKVPKSLIKKYKNKVMKYFVRYRALNKNGRRMRSSNSLVIGERALGPSELIASLFKDGKELKTSLIFKKEKQIFNYPFQRQKSQMIGSCNGLICIYNREGDNIALWNPTIRDLKVLPASKLQHPRLTHKIGNVSLGFDSCTRDYKVIHIPYPLISHIELYSLNPNSWRKYDHSTIPDRFYRPYDSDCMIVHRNETFCWVGIAKREPSSLASYTWSLYDAHNQEEEEEEETEEWAIISFDMKGEVFRPTPFPPGTLVSLSDGGMPGVCDYFRMFSLHDSIALVFYSTLGYNDERGDKSFQIWTIKDLQAEDSWTKLSNVRPFSGIIRPLGYWNNGTDGGKFIIMRNTKHELVFYDLGWRKIMTMATGIQLSQSDSTICLVHGYNRTY